MASLFGKKEENNEVIAEEKKEVATPVITKTADVDIARVLTQPRITEKATIGTAENVYVFDVAPDTNKVQIKEAIKKVYNVNPVKVHVSKIAKKQVRNMRTGIKGTKAGGKKAYVYLKKGESISIM